MKIIIDNNIWISFMIGIVIKNPSSQMVNLVERLRNHKVSQLEKLRNQKSCTFSINVQ